MIVLKCSESGNSVDVSGDVGEIAIFYCAWQTSLWPNWMEASVDKDGGPGSIRCFLDHLETDKNGIFAYDNTSLKKAMQFGVAVCRKLGIEFESNGNVSDLIQILLEA